MTACIVCAKPLEIGVNWSKYRAINYVNKCDSCSRIEKKEYARNLMDDPGKRKLQSERSKKHQAKLRAESPITYTARQMQGSAKKRALKKGIDYDITAEFIESICPKRCPVFNKDLIYGGCNKGKYGASLDRMDSSKGYTKDNVFFSLTSF